MRKMLSILLIIGSLSFVVGCTDAAVASYSLAKDTEMFKIKKRIVFLNGITDKYLLEITGFCSVRKDTLKNQLEVTCKVGQDMYKKHFLGISDNVTYMVEHLNSSRVNVYHYKVIFKPAVLIPDINILL